MTIQRLLTLTACLIAVRPTAAQPELQPPLSDLMSWRTSEMPEARRFRAKLATAAADLAAARLASDLGGKNPQPQDLQAALPPDAENAAPDYEQLVQLLSAKPLDTNGFIAVQNVARGSDSAVYRAAARALLEQRGDVMEIAMRAASKPHCVFKRDYSKGFDLNLSELQVMQKVAIVLGARQGLLSSDGRPQEAIALAQDVYRITRHAAAEPLVLPLLIGVAIEQTETRQLAAILRANANDTKLIAAVQSAARTWRYHPDLQKTERGEWIMASGEMNKLRKASPARWQEWIDALVPNFTLYANPIMPEKFSDDETKFLNALLDAVELRWRHGLNSLLPAHSETRRDPIDHFSALLPDYARIRAKSLSAQTQSAALLAACDVLLHKAKTGTWPQTLTEAGTKPDEKLPLRYTPTAEGFTIQSTPPAKAPLFVFP